MVAGFLYKKDVKGSQEYLFQISMKPPIAHFWENQLPGSERERKTEMSNYPDQKYQKFICSSSRFDTEIIQMLYQIYTQICISEEQ